MTNKPILCLDFDGVIHRYDTGWHGVSVIADPPTAGFFEWLAEAEKHFRIVIYSSRSKDEAGIVAMQNWITERHMDARPGKPLPLMEFASEKPPAFLTIDDRALRFTGNWDDFPPEELRQFKPWNKL